VGRHGLSRLTGYPEVILVCPQSRLSGKFGELSETPFCVNHLEETSASLPPLC
jgi:hypothetical protein